LLLAILSARFLKFELISNMYRNQSDCLFLYLLQARHVPAPAALTDQSVSVSSAQLLIDNAMTAWQKWCPVALSTQMALHPGSDDHCVCYRGKLYYLESERARQLFMAHPAKYLSVPPALPSNFVVAVLVSGGCADLGAVATAVAAPYGWRAVDASDGKLLTRPIVDAALDLYFTKSRTLAQAAVAAYQPALPTSDTTAASLKTAALEEERRLGDVLMALSQVEQADVPPSATAPASLRATRESTGLVIKLNTLSLDNDSIKGGSAASGLAVEKLVTDKEAAGVLDRRRLRHSAHARSQLDHLHARGIVPDLVIRLVNSSVPLDSAEGLTPTQIGWEEFEKILTMRGVASAQIDLALDANEPQDAKALANVALHRTVCRIRARMDPFVARAQPVPVSELSVNTIRQRMQLLRDSIEPRDGTSGSPTGSATIEGLCARTACAVCLIDGDRVVSSSSQHVLRLLPSQTLTACCSAACASKIVGVPGSHGVGAPIKRYSMTRNPFAPPPRLIVMGI
jgi:YHS domain-containing protein